MYAAHIFFKVKTLLNNAFNAGKLSKKNTPKKLL